MNDFFVPAPKIYESLKVRDFYKKYGESLKLELVAGEEGLNRSIREKSVNRPALAVTGYFKYFAAKRLQLFGAGEMGFLRDLKTETQRVVLREIVSKSIPCMVVSRGLMPTRAMYEVARESKVPLFRSRLTSKDFSGEATVILEHYFAPRTTLHGTLIDIKGIGTLIRGTSGIGKSEAALALIERGYSLVADDLTYVRLVNDSELVGTSSELNRGYMECRGIGIINIAELFGIRSIRLEKRIDLVITFSEWKPGMNEDRTGLESNTVEILGIRIPHMEIPVRPGRDMARLVEVAAMVQALKSIGHDSAKEFNDRLIAFMSKK